MGLPHVVVRHMSMQSTRDVKRCGSDKRNLESILYFLRSIYIRANWDYPLTYIWADPEMVITE